MKILIVGSGGREHAVVDALAQSPEVRKIYAAPGNGGICQQSELVSIDANDLDGLARFATVERIDLTFVGPEIFAKRFFKRNGIPTAEFAEASTLAEAYDVLERSEYPIVIKADGLAAGKGVVIAENPVDARRTVQQFMESRTLGEAGSRLVIEEFLEGEEASFQVFADGRYSSLWLRRRITNGASMPTRARIPAAWARTPSTRFSPSDSRTLY